MTVSSSVSLFFTDNVSEPVRVKGPSENYALEIRTSSTNAFWVTDGKASSKQAVLDAHPGADVLDAALAGVPSFVEEAGIISGSPSPSTGEYEIADVNYTLTDELASRFSNRQAVSGSVLTLYHADDGESFTDATIKRRNFGTTYGDYEGRVKIGFKGVHSLLKGNLFEKQVFRVADSFDDQDDFIPLAFDSSIGDPLNDVVMPAFQHDESYTTDPGLEIGYLVTSEGEVISYLGTTLKTRTIDGQVFHGVEVHSREEFGTLSVPVSVPGDATYSTLPTVTEFVYLEERVSDMTALIITGYTGDGRKAPDGWHMGVDPQYADYASFGRTVVGLDTSRLRFNNPEGGAGKDWLESKVLKDIPAVLVEDWMGRLSMRRRGTLDGSQTPSAVLDESNLRMDVAFAVEHPIDHMRNPIIMKRGWDPIAKKFTLADIVFNSSTLSMYGDLDPITYEFLGWDSSVGGQAQLVQQGLMLRDVHHSEGKKIVVESLPHMDSASVGDVVRLVRPKTHLTDSSTGRTVAQGIDQSFVVIAKEGIAETSTFRYALFATTGSAESTALSNRQRELSDGEYARYAPTLLEDVATHTLDGNGRQVFSGLHTVPGDTFYRIEGDATLAADFQLRPSARCQFLGIAHKQDLFVMSTDGAINCEGMSVYQGTTDPLGNPGYIGHTIPAGDVNLYQVGGNAADYNGIFRSSPSPQPIRPTLSSFSGWALSHHRSTLENIPSIMAGSGGAGVAGIRGGDGGASAVFMGKTLSRSTNGVYCNISGADAEGPLSVAGGSYYRGPAAPGSPGVFAIIVDGNNIPPPLDGEGILAFSGKWFEGSSVRAPSIHVPISVSNGVVRRQGHTATAKFRSYYQPTETINRWSAHSNIMFVPPDETLQERALNAFDALADAELGYDGKITLHPIQMSAGAPVFPENADINDYAAVETDLRDLNLPITSVRIWQLVTGGLWQAVTFPDVAAEYKIFAFRDRGATVLWVRESRPALGEYMIGDSWYNPASRRMYLLGATVGQDELISVDTFSDHTGFNLLVDPSWTDYASGADTLSFHQRWDEPLRTEATIPTEASTEGPGETSATYIAVDSSSPEYDTDGVVAWASDSGALVTASAAGSGHGRAFFGSSQGFVAANADRKVWVYAKSSGGSKNLILQGAGDTGPVGTVAQQQTVAITDTDYSWQEVPGSFGAFHASFQLRTNDAGLFVKRLIFIDAGSSSIPSGESGFGGSGTAAALTERPFWLAPTSGDRKFPLQQGGNRGPFQLLDTGEGNSLAWRVDFSGANTPNIITERFPWKAKPGTQYRATIRMRVRVTNGFNNPNKMGVAAQIEGFNDRNETVFTTDVQNGDSQDWFSINGSDYTNITQVVEIPNYVSRLAWGALKVVVLGDASGYAEIDSCEMVELPYRVAEFFSSEVNYYGVYTGTTNLSSNFRDVVTIPLQIKKGMHVTTMLEGDCRVDRIDVGSNSPSFSIGGVFRSVDLFGNSIGSVITYPEQLKHRSARYAFNPRIGTTTTYPPFMSASEQRFHDTTEFVAAYDISQVVLRATVGNGDPSGSSDLLLSDLAFTIFYGENLGDLE